MQIFAKKVLKGNPNMSHIEEASTRSALRQQPAVNWQQFHARRNA